MRITLSINILSGSEMSRLYHYWKALAYCLRAVPASSLQERFQTGFSFLLAVRPSSINSCTLIRADLDLIFVRLVQLVD